MPDIVTTSIEYPANGVNGMGYVARPDDGAAHPGVIVIQEWWGLDDHIKSIADRFAREGFVALAPDLYHGEFATEPDEARKLAMNMNREQAIKDLPARSRYLQSLIDVSPKKVGCIGFCMGGSMTLDARGGHRRISRRPRPSTPASSRARGHREDRGGDVLRLRRGGRRHPDRERATSSKAC